MNVLYLSSEVAPFSKTGGLGDVAGALPAALAERGHQVLVVTPRHSSVQDERMAPLSPRLALRFPFGEESARLFEVRPAKGHRVVFVDHEGYFARAGLYDEQGDNHRRFGFFSMAGLSAAQALGFLPDIVHLNDWQTGLAAAALRGGYQATPLSSARCVFAIHNLAYQGNFPPSALAELGVPKELFTPQGLEFYGQLSFLKAGLVYADALTTVSPRYAKEVQTPEGGAGMDGVLRERSGVLRGILNGVDYRVWNPETDRTLPANFSAKDLSGKELCKRKLLERFGLPVPPSGKEGPLVFGMVSRLVEQKGIELLLSAIPRVLEREVALVVLGSGEKPYEDALKELKQRHPRQVGIKLGFDEALAHLVEAGSDFFVMPSRFEPCGLNQLYSLRYGAVPIVHAVGGLDDTVVDLAMPGGTGIKFQEYQAPALARALRRAIELYADRKKLAEVRRRGMACDFSWEAAAAQYESLYRSLLAGADKGR